MTPYARSDKKKKVPEQVVMEHLSVDTRRDSECADPFRSSVAVRGSKLLSIASTVPRHLFPRGFSRASNRGIGPSPSRDPSCQKYAGPPLKIHPRAKVYTFREGGKRYPRIE